MSALTTEMVTVSAKKRGRPKGVSNRGEGKAVRIDPDVFAKAKMVVTRRNLELGPYLSKLLEFPVDRDYASVLRELADLEAKK